jgi:PAS domain S-box-containing protein
MAQRPSETAAAGQPFQLLVEAVSDYAIYMLDPEGHVVSWNPGAERIKGYSGDEIIGRHFSLFFSEADRNGGKPQRALATARSIGRIEDEGWRIRKDGSRFWALAVLEAIRDEQGGLIGYAKITRDMTERRAAQEALRESERRFRLLIESVSDYAIFMLDTDGRVTNWNAGAQRIKGYRADEIVGEHYSRFFIDEEREAGLPEQALKAAATTGRYRAEGWRLRKDGSRFWANVVIDPVRDEGGTLIGYAKVTRDVTEHRAAQQQLEETQAQLFQAQKMEAIGQLTGGIAHDFNNLLTIIMGGLDIAERHAGDRDKLNRLIDSMRHAARRGAALTRQLLAFSRRQSLRPERLDLHQQLRTAADLLSRSLRPDIALSYEIAPDVWPAEVDPGQLELALLNIGLNARDAMPDGGELRITVHNAEPGDVPGALDGDFIAISVADTGSGMTEEVRARAFEPFFTTKAVSRGSGLGLSQVYGFARQSGGMVEIDSRLGQGTTVTVYLPRSCAEDAAQKPVPGPLPLRAGAGDGTTILLVEDDADVAELTTGLLESAGYSVRNANSSEAAMERLKAGERVDVVLSDIMMSGTNGAELARTIRRDFPGIFVLLTTGYAEAAASQIAREFPVITKPYDRDSLLGTLREMIGEVD